MVANSEGRTDEPATFATFIVRISQNNAGTVNAVVEWVRTGEKVRVNELTTIGEVIIRMVERASRQPDARS